MLCVFMDIYFTVQTKMYVSVQIYAAGAEGLNIKYL